MSTVTVSELQITNLNQSYLIQVPISLNTSEVSAFQQTFNHLCKRQSTNISIVLDFSQTEFIESRGIGVLLDSVKVAKNEGINLVFWSVSPQIKMQLSSANPEFLPSIDPGTEPILINSKQNRRLTQELKPMIKLIVNQFNLNSSNVMGIKRLYS
ncbi:MAG: STAS domain-containing protein [Coleofasciculus sp. S288]|nr:STAS domain-containing protein [Coleofasciculus sp. S288]